MKKFKVLKEMKIGNKVIKPGSVITIMEDVTAIPKEADITIKPLKFRTIDPAIL